MKWRQRNWNSGGVKWVRWAVSSTVFFFVCLFVFFLTINENALLHTSTPILELVEAKNLFFSRFWIKFTVSYQNLTKHHNTIFLKIETYPHNMYISLWPNVYIPHHPQYIIYPKKKLRYFHDSTQKKKKLIAITAVESNPIWAAKTGSIYGQESCCLLTRVFKSQFHFTGVVFWAGHLFLLSHHGTRLLHLWNRLQAQCQLQLHVAPITRRLH